MSIIIDSDIDVCEIEIMESLSLNIVRTKKSEIRRFSITLPQYRHIFKVKE